MKQTKVICDLCKKEVIVNYFDDSNFKTVTLEFGQYNKRRYDLCPDCLTKHGLIDTKNKEKPIPDNSIQEKLFEIIAEIVSQVQEV